MRSRKRRHNDPMVERESKKYTHPIASRELIQSVLGDAAQPMTFEGLADTLSIEGDRDLEALRRRLGAMERDGQILRNRRNRYGLAQRMDMVCGHISGHPDGYGFLISETGGEDVFLSPREMRLLMHGDRVMVRVTREDRRGRREGAVVEVLERAHALVVGRYTVQGRLAFVIPEDRRLGQDVVIPVGDGGRAQEGQIVVAEVTQYPTRTQAPVGRVTEVLGTDMAPGMETEIAIRSHGLPYHWPPEVTKEADQYADEIPSAAYQGREDLRDLPLVTIDGEDARDFDDAVYCQRHDRGWRLIVAIADVSYYVRPQNAMDREAYHRGNSVYFPQRVIPMLPEKLSNGLCSLRPAVDRLCLACEVIIGPKGEISKHRFFEGVIRSAARLTYQQVADALAQGSAAGSLPDEGLLVHLQNLYSLYRVLYAARLRRGSLELELPETRITFDSNKKIEAIYPLERNDAHRLIEECMLAANVCAANLISKHKAKALYRIHEGPNATKLEALREYLFELGLSLGGGDQPMAKHFAKLIQQIGDRPDRHVLHTMLLRSQNQAVYSPENNGHFALAYESYTHFTSPIRRYPDLLVHRAIKCIIKKKPYPTNFDEAKQQGEHCSMTERRADEATRDAIRWLKAEYMQDHVGDTFDGIISSVTSFGVFVELSETLIDGLIHITELGNDYYHFDPVHHRLVGERSRARFGLGDRVRVRVLRVDLDQAKIDLALAQESADARRTTERPRRRVKTRRRKHPPKRTK